MTGDLAKAESNLIKHGVRFESAAEFDWHTASTFYDVGHSAEEDRYTSVGHIGPRQHVMIWTPRGAKVRIISLRKANDREMKYYDSRT